VRAIIEYLQSVLPGSSFNDVEPLEVLLIILGDLNTGALRLDPVWRKQAPSACDRSESQMPSHIGVASERGLEKRAADNLVCTADTHLGAARWTAARAGQAQ